MKQYHINKYQPHRGSECRLTASPNGRQSYIFWLYLIQRIYRITKKSYGAQRGCLKNKYNIWDK